MTEQRKDLKLSALTAEDWNGIIERAINKRHRDGLLWWELRTTTGYSLGDPQRIDAFHMAEVPSKGFLKTAYEVKVSRADFLRELKAPAKRRAAVRFSNFFYFITPPGVVKVPELPLECGLVECSDDGFWNIVVEAPYRDAHPPTWPLLAAVARKRPAIPREAGA